MRPGAAPKVRMRKVFRFASAAATLRSGDSSEASAEEPVWQALETSGAAPLGARAEAGVAGAFCAGAQMMDALRSATMTPQLRARARKRAVVRVVLIRPTMRSTP